MKSTSNDKTEVLKKAGKVPTADFDNIYIQASEIIVEARNTAYRQINEALVRRNWMLGRLIAEQELHGKERAANYGLDIIIDLSKRLTATYGKGFNWTSLYAYVKFYEMFPKIVHTACGKSLNLLSWSHYHTIRDMEIAISISYKHI